MITNPPAASTAAVPPGQVRLATRISEGTARRLRMAAVLNDKRLGQLIDDLLDEALPTAADLAAQMKGAATDEHI